MKDYVKTGEDKDFEYYRNDSEVMSGDGEEQAYAEILAKRSEYNVKIGDKDITIKKRTLSRIIILSECEPAEQILFTLYKTIYNPTSHEATKTNETKNDTYRSNFNESEKTRTSKVSNKKYSYGDNGDKEAINVNDPLSGKQNDDNNLKGDENVINVPINGESDNEELMCKKDDQNNQNNVLLVSLPPEGIKIKWFYLLLALVGIMYILLFIISLSNKEVGFIWNNFCLCIFGAFLLITGLIGFVKINKRIYNCGILQAMTIICIILGILGIIFINSNQKTKENYLTLTIILGSLCCVFSILCIIWTIKLKKASENILGKKMEKLVDYQK